MANKLGLLIVLIASALFYQLGMVVATTFTLINKCDYTVWPGILSNAGISQLSITGFALQKGESQTINPPTSWGGRIWGRTLCSTDKTTGEFTCKTGDCGSGKVECIGGNAATPATLAEFTLNGSENQDFFDVSLVDGYNLPMLVKPEGGNGQNCTTTGCAADLNSGCPSELRVLSDESSVACRSACDAFNEPQYCCSGAFGNPDTCKPSSFSMVFKKACPRAYSYAYDDKSSTFVCGGSPDYTITFCPSPNTSSQKASSDQSPPTATSSTNLPYLLNSSMVYEGALDVSNAKSSRMIGFRTGLWLVLVWVMNYNNNHQLFQSLTHWGGGLC